VAGGGVGGGLEMGGLEGGVYGFAKFLALCFGVYLLFRVISWGRNKLLWSLRNRLVIAYIFIAVVPILLILTGAILGARILYSQFGAYLFYEDIHTRVETIRDMAEHISAAHSVRPPGASEEELEKILATQSHAVHDRDLPGLSIAFSDDTALLRKISGDALTPFAGLLQQGEFLFLTSIRAIPQPKKTRVVRLSVQVTPDFLASIAPDLGT